MLKGGQIDVEGYVDFVNMGVVNDGLSSYTEKPYSRHGR